MVYESMVYISQYIPSIETSMHVDHIWDVNSIKTFEGEHLLGKGRIRKVKGKWRFKIHLIFYFYVYDIYLNVIIPSIIFF